MQETEDKLYQIGEFASMNKVSARMLRHYDKINLFHPILMKDNGYRYYSEQQIGVISQIKLLRSCEFTLDEIAQILKNDNNSFFMEQAKYKIAELSSQAYLHKKTITLLEELCQKDLQNTPSNQYGISIISCFATNLFQTIQTFHLEQIETQFEKLFMFLEKRNLTADGCAVLISHFSEKDDNKNQVGIPITETFHDEHYQTLVLPPSKRISTIHYGDYYTIGYAYSSIMNYAKQHNYVIEPYFMERYFIDCSHTTNPNQYVTEISVSFQNKP